jgi:hypothetical protein
MNQLENQKKGERIDLLPSPIQMRAPSPAVHFLGATKSAGTEPPGSVAADGQILQVPLNQSFLLRWSAAGMEPGESFGSR